jgi:hypothetical protein
MGTEEKGVVAERRWRQQRRRKRRRRWRRRLTKMVKIQWQKKLERRIHSSRGDFFMNRKTNGINYII